MLRRLRLAIMRMIAPTCEGERAAFRQAMDHAQAHAEDLNRTLELRGPDLGRMMGRVREMNNENGDTVQARK